jgi:hypothetical protein
LVLVVPFFGTPKIEEAERTAKEVPEHTQNIEALTTTILAEESADV